MSKRLVNAFSLLLEARVGPIFSTSRGIAKFSSKLSACDVIKEASVLEDLAGRKKQTKGF